MLCALPVPAAARPAIRQRERVPHRCQQQLTPACRPASPSSSHGFTLRGNYTLSHCLDEVSNGGLLSFSTQGILSPLPGELSRQYGNCDYDVRHNISAFGIVPDSVFVKAVHFCARCFAAGRFLRRHSFTAGFPSRVLSQPYTANGNGVFQASGPSLPAAFPACRSIARLRSPA